MIFLNAHNNKKLPLNLKVIGFNWNKLGVAQKNDTQHTAKQTRFLRNFDTVGVGQQSKTEDVLFDEEWIHELQRVSAEG